MSDIQPTVPLSECVRLGRELHSMESQRDALERENAALREDKETYAGLLPLLARWLRMADDCHSECQEVGYSEYNITAGLLCDTRAAIDATRKEAKP